MVWWTQALSPDNDNGGYAGRMFDPSGPLGDQFDVSTELTVIPFLALDVDANRKGDFVVAWTGYYGEAKLDDRGPIVRFFCGDTDVDGSCDRVFGDGFESGTVAAWTP